MKNKKIKVSLATLSLITTFSFTASSSINAKQYLAQNSPGPKKLTVIDIEKQVEIRLNKVWSGLPSIPPGGATMDFTIKNDGSLANLFAVKSSGNPQFDKAAMGTIKRVIPLPNLPEHLDIKSIKLRAQFAAGQMRQVKLSFAPLSFGTPPAMAQQNRPPKQMQSNRPPAQPVKQIQPPRQNPVRPPINKANRFPPANNFQQPNRVQQPIRSQQPNQVQPANQFRQARPNPQMDPVQKANILYKLVNLGVVSINAGDYNTAIRKLEEALRIDPNHQVAKQNLAIAYNNYGLKLQTKPQEALNIYHKAINLDPSNQKTKSNLDAVVTMLGKNPNSFNDRKALGDQAFNSGDRIGAKVEYLAALKLKRDPALIQKLNQLQGRGPVVNKAQPRPNGAKPIPAAKPKPVVKRAAKPKPKPKPKPVAKRAAKPKPKSKPMAKARNKLDQVYGRLASLEKKLFGKTFASDDILARLSRLERKSFGKTQTGSAKRRLDALLLAN